MPPKTEFKDVLGHPVKITKSSIENAVPRIVRVRNRLNLEDLSNLHTSPSASYFTHANTVVGVVDTALRVNGLVPSWVVEESISPDQKIESGSIFLNRICGVETFFQLLHPNYYLDGFSPAVYLMAKSGEVEATVGVDISKLNLADYQRLVIGVQFTPVEMPIPRVIIRWRDRYHGLSDGDIQLTQILDSQKRLLIGAYSLTGGLGVIEEDELKSGVHVLRNALSRSGKRNDCNVAGDSLIAVVDRKLAGKGIYGLQDTYIDGQRYRQNNVYLVSVPGLEKALLYKFKIVDPRDIGVLIETTEMQPKNGMPERTEPGKGRLAVNEITATPGMQYDVIAMVQGVYDRRDQLKRH